MSGESLENPSDSNLNMEDYHLIQAVYNKPNVHRRLMRHAKSPKGYSTGLVQSPLAAGGSSHHPKSSGKAIRPTSSKPYPKEAFQTIGDPRYASGSSRNFSATQRIKRQPQPMFNKH